ncbi:MAG TPA: hypothetical protein VKU60_13780 [Chloroflexota bacterium]|nr:hypothetical protein [Chloroflexota bacterium]
MALEEHRGALLEREGDEHRQAAAAAWHVYPSAVQRPPTIGIHVVFCPMPTPPRPVP